MGDIDMENRKKIGVLDSGVGGLTVVKELEKLMPNEDIVYFGDNKNCPYGNRTADDIVGLTRKMIEFLKDQEVKVVAVACNTISSLIDRYGNDYDFPVFGIIEPASQYVVDKGVNEVGVVATEFTINSKCYNRLINEKNPNLDVYGEGSRNLAMLVDCGEFDMKAIEEDISLHMGNLLKRCDVKDVILGCTHYPIVQDVFEKYGPGINFINPALQQAKKIKAYLEENNLLNDEPHHAYNIYTSGTTDTYEKLLKILDIKTPFNIKTV